MKDYSNYVEVIWIGLGVIFLLGFVVLTIAEIFLLKKKGWLDETISLRYPIITNLVNIPIAAITNVISIWVLLVVAMLGVGYVEFYYRKDYPGFSDAVGIAFYVFAFVFLFLAYLIAFFLVRLLMTSIMVRSSNLTWKYTAGQSLFPAILLMIITSLFIGTFYL